MKVLSRIALVCIMLLSFACKNDAKPEVKTIEIASENVDSKKNTQVDPNVVYQKAEFGIKGMTCAMGCAKTIEKKIAKLEGVRFVSVDFKNELAMVEFDKDVVKTSDLVNTVTSVSDVYKVENLKSVDTFSKDLKCCAKKAKTCDKSKKACDKSKEGKDCKKACDKDAKKVCGSKEAKTCNKSKKTCDKSKEGKTCKKVCDKSAKTCDKNKKECTKSKTCKKDCTKPCCDKKDAKTCEKDCKKACCTKSV